MASTIKGITVKIAGETTDLQKALKNIQSSSRSLQSELKTINNQLKFDPDNTVLLAQKQDVLREQIDNSTDALKQLLDVEEQVKDQAKNGEISTDQYRAFQREVEKAKSQLENFKKQLEETEAAAKSVNMKPLVDEMSNVKSETDKAGDSFKELEGKSKNTDLSKFKKELDDVKESTSKLKTTINETATEIFTSAGVIGGAAVTAITSANSDKKALNSLQVQTGLTSSELMDYKSVINDIYTDNFGESQEEIADTLAKIKQLTGETDPTKLKNMAENLYTLQDSFEGFDIGETLRGVNGLVTNMGLSAEEAFEYIVKGAQNGLNYSGELADNMAEYSQIWGQAGFSAEQAFSILENGTKSGAYNLDKVNDFVKEFTISLADGRIEENLGSFSDDTAELFNKWKDGKATAADVFYSVINDLKNAKNDQEALTTASNVWSALGEDNALKVITSLGNVNNSYKNVQGSMEKIKDIKYDDVESDFENLGRTVKTDIIQPIGKELYPVAKKTIKWASENLDDLLILIEGLGKQVAIVWGTKKAKEITSSLYGVINSYKSLTTATNLAAEAQKGLNSAQALNVIGTITTLVLGLISAVQTYNELQWSNSEAGKFCEEIDKIKDNLEESTQKITDNLKGTLEDIDNLYADNTLVDSYQKKLDELLSKATLTPEEQAQLQTIVTYFSNNVDGFSDTWDEYVRISDEGKIELNGDLDEVKNKINSTIDDYQKLANSSALAEMQTENSKTKISAKQERAEIKVQYDTKFEEIEKKLKNSGKTYGWLIGEYEKYKDNSLKADDRVDARNRIENALGKGGYEELNSLMELKEKYNESTAAVNKLTMVSDDLSDVQKLLNGDYSDAAAVLMAYNAGMISQNDILSATDETGKKVWASMSDLKEAAKESGKNTILGLVEGTKEYQGALVKNSNGWCSEIVSSYDTTMEIHSPSEVMRRRGRFTAQGLILGMRDKDGDVSAAGSALARKAKNGTNSVSLFDIGNNFVQGFINGISDGDAIKNVWSVASGVGGLALGAVKKILGINSPSKEAKKLGCYFTEGLTLGINSNKNKVKSSTESIAQILLDNFDLPEFNFDFRTINDKFNNIRDLDSAVSNSVNKTVTNSPTVKLNFGDVIINNDTDIDRFNERVSAAVIDALGKEC